MALKMAAVAHSIRGRWLYSNQFSISLNNLRSISRNMVNRLLEICPTSRKRVPDGACGAYEKGEPPMGPMYGCLKSSWHLEHA